MRVIASSIRKGNIIEHEDGQLYVVLTAESFHPGKGTPTTQIDMRRLSDGTKVSNRYKTTENVERAFVEDHDFSYLYEDGDGYTFMNDENYEQVIVTKDTIGDQAVWLQEGMKVILSMFNGNAVAIQLPPRVTLEITDDGVGYRPAASARAGHFGVSGMAERAALVGGALTVEDRDGAGTRVVATIPVHQTAAPVTGGLDR